MEVGENLKHVKFSENLKTNDNFTPLIIKSYSSGARKT